MVTRIRLADRIAHAMLDRGWRSIIWGDGLLVDVARQHVSVTHPLDIQIAALNALGRAPDLFTPGHVRVWTGRREQRVRSFRLIGVPRRVL